MPDEPNTIAEETTPNEESPNITPSSAVKESYADAQQEPTEPNSQNIPNLEDSSSSVPLEGPGANGDDLKRVGYDNIPLSDSSKTENTLNSSYIEPEKVIEKTSPKDGQAIPEIVALSQLKNIAKELLIKARKAIQIRKRKKLDKIMNLFLANEKITNDEVEKFLHVSDATATRYLAILKKEGKIKQNGKTGQGVSYSKI